MQKGNFVLSPSKLETYRLYRHGEYNDTITKDEVVDTIMGVKKYTPAMDRGTAYHEMLENGVGQYRSGNIYQVRVGPNMFAFEDAHVKPIVEFRVQHPNMVYECWLPFTIKLGSTNVRFRSRVDGLEGNVIHEFKTGSKVDVPRFERSVQWKLYTLGLDVRCVHYHTFKFKMNKEVLVEVEPLDFKFYRNAGTDAQVFELINDFIEFCYIEGIEHKIIDGN